MLDDRISEDDQYQLNIEWAACDDMGHIGIFESGGYAPIPESILSSNSNRRRVIEYFKKLSGEMQAVRHYEILSKSEFENSDFEGMFKACEAFAKNGLYVYSLVFDFRRMLPHERILSPQYPRHISSLPLDIANIVVLTKIPVSFKIAQQIPLETVAACSE